MLEKQAKPLQYTHEIRKVRVEAQAASNTIHIQARFSFTHDSDSDVHSRALKVWGAGLQEIFFSGAH